MDDARWSPQPMAESAVEETVAEIRETGPKSPIAEYVGKMSDRAIQRVVGGNAFLRGRLYARRKVVVGLTPEGTKVSGEIAVRSAEEPYRTSVEIAEDGKLASACSCPG